MTAPFLNWLGSQRIYPITNRQLSGLSHAEQVRKLAERGMRVIQLREKQLSPIEFYREAEEAVEVGRQLAVKIIINDRVDLALALGADGIHLGQADLPLGAARRLLGANAIIGFSTHSVAQAVEAAKLPISYLALGPIFPTLTKESSNSAVGLDGIAAVRLAVSTIPLVAIGGITANNRAAVIAAGADAVAMISDLWPAQVSPLVSN